MDRLNPQRRSENMRRIRSEDTGPELQVRRLVHSLGLRFRLHDKALPGKPDLVFRSRKSVIFVHGCFWHLHGSCREGRVPSTRQEYWLPKLTRNAQRDREHLRELKKAGWRVLVIWECEVCALEKLARKLDRFLCPEKS
jgi:DNA mismatch endonuclease (patch repair protein)